MTRSSWLASLVLLACAHQVQADSCALLTGASSIDYDLSALSHAKLKFVGFESPVVSRVGSTAGESKLVITSYSHVPELSVVDGQLVISADSTDCNGTAEMSKASSSSFSSLLLVGTMAMAMKGESPMLAASLGAVMMAVGGSASCTPVIEVEIHTPMTQALVDSAIMEMNAGGEFMTCPAETLQWTHESTVYMGYSGCVGEAGLAPCSQDGFEGVGSLGGDVNLNKPFTYNTTTGACVASGYDMSNMTLWILWGLPMDTKELITRTGLNPVVSFPLLRMTYPSYKWGSHGDDAADMKAKFKDFLVYEGAFTTSELAAFDVEVSEGAEAGIVELYAAMALSIAQTTCNRDIYVLVEAPAYGYSNTRAAEIVNSKSSSFYVGTECPCWLAGTCDHKTVTISTRGWMPGETLPSAIGADGGVYSADNTSAASPWFETMVYPENPSGVRKTPQLAADRRICDGVYLFPMYFGADNWAVPSTKPDCIAWSFSITKIYSAAVRAGAIIYKSDKGSFTSAVESVMSSVHGIADGIYSEWSWMGQMQIYDMIMSKPLSDSTSWIGAYSELMKAKWDLIIDGFANCPVLEVTNPYQGAYVWFKYLGSYRGKQSSFVSSFFLECLGVKTTTYYWGFRGADPSAYYGTGYGTYDFTRLQLYRDLSVYAEVSRRAKIVCGGGSVAPYLSYADWSANNRRLSPKSIEEHEEDLKATVPHIDDSAAKHLAALRQDAAMTHENVEKHCANEGYTTSCLFQHAGKDGEDIQYMV